MRHTEDVGQLEGCMLLDELVRHGRVEWSLSRWRDQQE